MNRGSLRITKPIIKFKRILRLLGGVWCVQIGVVIGFLTPPRMRTVIENKLINYRSCDTDLRANKYILGHKTGWIWLVPGMMTLFFSTLLMLEIDEYTILPTLLVAQVIVCGILMLGVGIAIRKVESNSTVDIIPKIEASETV